MEQKEIKVKVELNGKCKKIFIPKGFCTIVLEGQAKGWFEESVDEEDYILENLSKDMPCQSGK